MVPLRAVIERRYGRILLRGASAASTSTSDTCTRTDG